MSRSIVLSHPYSGAMYAFFKEQIHGEPIPDPESIGHSYYRTLYGDEFRSMTNMALTLALMYDRVVMAPADAVLPDYKNCLDKNGDYQNNELGLESNWSDYRDNRSEIEQKVSADLVDPVVSKILRRVPEWPKRQILNDARMDMLLASKYKCPIVCSKGRRALIMRLFSIETEYYSQSVAPDSVTLITEEYLRITGLVLNPRSIGNLYQLRANNELKRYSQSFVAAVERFREGEDARQQLVTAMREAIDTASYAGYIEGFFDGVSQLLSIPGVIPIVGTPFSGASVAASAVARIAERAKHKHMWYELDAQVRRAESLGRIVQYLDQAEIS